MSSKSRTRQNRRDRRLAKQSNWTRPGKSNPKKVGHGGSGQKSNPTSRALKPKTIEPEKKADPLKVPFLILSKTPF